MSTITTTPTDRSLGPLAESEHRRFMTWAGWSGLAASIAYITTIVATNLLGSVEPYDGPQDVGRYLEEVGDDVVRYYVYGIAGIVMCVLFTPFAIAVYSKLRRGAAAGLGSLAMIVGLMMLVPGYAVSILEAAALAPVATELGADANGAIYATAEAGEAIAAIFFSLGSVLTLCFAPLLWAIDGRRQNALPSWLIGTGVVVGVTGLVWFVWFHETPIILVALLLNLVASLVFFIPLARRLLEA